MADDDNPYEKMLEEMRALLQKIEDHKNIPLDDLNIPKDVQEKLEKIERDVCKFEALSEKILTLSKEEIPKNLQPFLPPLDEGTTPQEKRLIQKSNELLTWAKSLQQNIIEKEKTQIQPSVTQEPPKTKKELEKGSGKKRKGKFRHMGGDINRKIE